MPPSISSFQFEHIKESKKKIFDKWTQKCERLRLVLKVEFMDYNIVKVEKNYRIKFTKELDEYEEEFFIWEKYNIKNIDTHNLKIFFNGFEVDPIESNNKIISEINNCYKVILAERAHKSINSIIEDIENISNNKIISIFSNLKEQCDNFFKRLINYYAINPEMKDYISKPLDITNIIETLEQVEQNLSDSPSDLLKLMKSFRKDTILRENIAKLSQSIDILLNSRYYQLIAIFIPKDLMKKTYPYAKIKITTEEPYSTIADFKILLRKSYLVGDSCEFTLKVYRLEEMSTYLEINPPKNTRISNHIICESAKICNIFMEQQMDEFDERLVIHVPRKKYSEEKYYLEQFPRLFITFKPYKTLQTWVSISLILGIFFNIVLAYIIGGFILNSYVFKNSSIFIFLSLFFASAKIQGTWIFGLIIGNQLWLQKPRFLWRKTTFLAITIILIGAILLLIAVIIDCNLTISMSNQ